MKGLGSLLNNRQLIILIGVFFLILLIVLLGAWLKVSIIKQLIAIIIVLFLWVLAQMIERMMAMRKADALQSSMSGQADKNMQGLKPGKREEIEQLQRQFLAGIDKLKKSKLAKGGKAALYALPWYVVIGPPGIGKTTAIQNSGLDPEGIEKIKGVGGTRNCDWFFTSSGIFLDTAGRYTSDTGDNEEWLSFLQILKKQRKRQPINGVVVGVSIKEIGTATFEQIEDQAYKIRRRIDELISHLGVNFPVYLIFTKCDLLQGFVDFFEELNKSEREQIWGCTFSVEQQKSPEKQDIFEKEFQQLLQALEDFRFKRLSVPQKRDQRLNIYVFPMELAAIRENLSYFTAKLFRNNPYLDNPIFRGFYFTSGTQEGVPIDCAIQAIAMQFDLPPHVIAPFDPKIQIKSYFIKNVFKDIILPDHGLTQETSKSAGRRRVMHFVFTGFTAVGLLAFILIISNSYVKSKNTITEIKQQNEKISALDWGDSRVPLLEKVENLEIQRQRMVKIENSLVSLHHFGLDRSSKLLPKAQEIYYDKVRELIESKILPDIQYSLESGMSNEGSDRNKLHSFLKAYLLLGPKYSLLDTVEQRFLAKKFDEIFNHKYYSARSQGEAQQIRPLLKNQFAYFAKLAGRKSKPTFAIDQMLVARVTNLITVEPSAISLIDQIKASAETIFPPATIRTLAGNRYASVFADNAEEVSGFYSKKAWEDYISKEIKIRSESPAKDDWVLGRSPENLPAWMRDPALLKNTLEELYFNQYRDSWQNFFNNIMYVYPSGLAETARFLEVLGDKKESPLQNLINNAGQNLQFGSLNKAKQSEQVEGKFAPLCSLSSNGGKQEAFGKSLQQYADLSKSLQGLEGKPEDIKKAAIAVLDNGGMLQPGLNDIVNSYPDLDGALRQTLLEQPILAASAALFGETQAYLNAQWSERVYEPFRRTLENKYPFAPSATDASIIDFEKYFRSSGPFWSFLQNDLQSLLSLNGDGDMAVRNWRNQSIAISEQTQRAVSQAMLIRKRLFYEDKLEAAFDLIIDPDNKPHWIGANPGAFLDAVILTIDGKELSWLNNKPFPTDFRWPSLSKASAKLQVRTSVNTIRVPHMECLGSWGLFKLLDLADVRRRIHEGYKFNVTWQVPYSSASSIFIRYILDARQTDNAFDPVSRRNMFSFSCPQKLN